MNSIIISRSSGGYSNTTLTEWITDTPRLVKTFQFPTIGFKDGSYFIRCSGTKRNNTDTSDIAYVIILDGDSHITEDGVIVAGAPNPELVSMILTRLGLWHLIYSSHSNGATREELEAKTIDSGGAYDADYHKYRVIIPCTYSPEQLPVLLDYLFNELHRSGVMLAQVNENKTWSQPWYFPRVPDEQRKALFRFYHHDGALLDVDAIPQDWLKNQPEPEQPKHKPYKPQPGEHLTGWRNPIKEFNQTWSVRDVLIRNGYIKKGLKYLRPESESKNPGVQLCLNCKDGAERVYSHGNDVLNDDWSHDAFDCYRLLECEGDLSTALDWSKEITKHNQRLFMQEQAKKDKSNNADWNGDIDSLFNDIVLTQEHVDKMANTHFLIPNIIAQGHVTVYAAPANGGKSALFRYFCEILSKDRMKVIYVNVDAGPGDLKKHYAHAKEHNYKVIAPDACEGKSADDVTKLLRTIADGSVQCGEYVFVLDTLKMFTDVINKTKAKEFYKLLRKLTVKGATICLLGHCNKYKDEEGRHIYEGTADLRNDIDDLIYLDSFLNEQTNILEVTTRPDKVRAEFHPVSFNIDKNNGLKVTMNDKVINILPEEDREIIDLAKWAITEGNESQGDIIEYIKERLDGVGDKKIKNKLKFYSTGPRAELKATSTGLGRGLKYEAVY